MASLPQRNVVFISSEMAPWAKVGGLADVVGSLPKALAEIGVTASIILPRYEHLDVKKLRARRYARFEVAYGGRKTPTTMYRATLPGSFVPVYLLEHRAWLSQGSIYGKPPPAKEDDYLIRRALFFCTAALNALPRLPHKPDVIHTHDWLTSFACRLLKLRAANPFYAGIKSVLTIHNLDHQEYANENALAAIGVKAAGLAQAQPNKQKKLYVNLLGEGMLAADRVNTVSPYYASEIRTAEYGHGLDRLIRRLPQPVTGILNGIDTRAFNPATDRLIARRYTAATLPRKRDNKAALQRLAHLPEDPAALLCGMVSRLAAQKGLELLIAAINKLAGQPFQFVILGEGDPDYTAILSEMAREQPQRLAFLPRFDLAAAQAIYAGADCFLMPSRFEPCGLGQLIALRYGTVPIVRDTGGLHDTVPGGKAEGQGFLFKRFSAEDFVAALVQARRSFLKPARWRTLQTNAMRADHSWRHSAKAYAALYEAALGAPR